MYVVTLLFATYSEFVEQLRSAQYAHYKEQQHPAVIITPEQFRIGNEQTAYLLLGLQVMLMCLIWFWARWKIRDYVWNKFRPGGSLYFLHDASEWVENIVGFVLMLVLLAMVWATTYVSSFLRIVLQTVTAHWA